MSGNSNERFWYRSPTRQGIGNAPISPERGEIANPKRREDVPYLGDLHVDPMILQQLITGIRSTTLFEWLKPDLDSRYNFYRQGTGLERLGFIIAEQDPGRYYEETLYPAATSMLRGLRRQFDSTFTEHVKEILGEKPMTLSTIEAGRALYLAEQAKLRGRALSAAAQKRNDDWMQEIQSTPDTVASVAFVAEGPKVVTEYRFGRSEFNRNPYSAPIDFSHLSNTYEAQVAARIVPRLLHTTHPVLEKLLKTWK